MREFYSSGFIRIPIRIVVAFLFQATTCFGIDGGTIFAGEPRRFRFTFHISAD